MALPWGCARSVRSMGRERVLKVRVCFHDKCFDGASSAAIFSRFYRERINPDAEFLYTGMTHKASAPFEDGTFDGDENAIVDFKYSSSPLLTCGSIIIRARF